MTPEELKNIAPKLFELQKLNHGFDIPKGYFESVEESLASSLFLDTLTKQHSFDIPENYFDTIESTVFETIELQNASIPKDYFSTIETNVFERIQNKSKVISIKKNIFQKFVPLTIAASILLIFTIQFFNSTEINQFASIDTFEIEQWIDNGELEISTYEVASIYHDITIETLDIYDFYQDDEILNYLDDIDIEPLILTN